jgi:hypothetical protein
MATKNLRWIATIAFALAASNAAAISTSFDTFAIGKTFPENSFVHAGDVNLKVTKAARITDDDPGAGVDKRLELGSGGIEFQLPAVVDQLSFSVVGGSAMWPQSVNVNGVPASAFGGFATLNGQEVGGVGISFANNLMTLNGPINAFRISAIEYAIDDVFINAPTPTADFDGDGDADGNDFLRWQRNLGMAAGAGPTSGDADFDHDVDSIDLVNWRGRFGRTSGAIVAATHVVPEPYGGAMLVTLLLAAVRRRAAWRLSSRLGC